MIKVKGSKLVYVLGSIIIGIVAVLFVFAGLIFTGIIDNKSRKLVYKSLDATIIYDGTTLVQEEVELISGELKAGHTAVATVTGEQSVVGDSENLFTITIFDKNGADVSKDYEIECQPGTLTVTPRPISVKADDAEKVYDGTPLDCENYIMSVGDLVDGHELSCIYTGEITDVGTAKNTVACVVLDAREEDVTANYAITYLEGTLKVTPRPITVESMSWDRAYNGQELTYEIQEITEGSLAEGDNLEAKFTGKITEAGEVKNEFSVTIKRGEKNVTTNYEIDYDFGKLTITPYKTVKFTTKSDTHTYDTKEFSCEEWDFYAGYKDTFTELFSDYKVIPTFMGGITDVGSEKNEATFSILNADGKDVTSSFVIEVYAGTLTVEPFEIYLQTDSANGVYDGTPLMVQGWDYQEGSPKVFGGHTLTVDCTGSQTNVGESKNTANYTVIEDETGHPITKNYTFSTKEGTLSVTKRVIYVITASKTQVYDGTPLTQSDGWYLDTTLGAKLVEGHQFNPEFGLGITDVGEASNEVTYWTVTSPDGTIDYTSNYELRTSFGKLTVTPIILTVKTGTPSAKIYDGESLEFRQYEHIGGTLVAGHTLNVDVTGCCEIFGKAANTFEWSVTDGKNDLSSNYEMKSELGTLEIIPRPITIQAGSYTKMYNGQPLAGHEEDCQIVSVYQLAGDDELGVLSLSGSQTNAGVSYNIVASVKIVDKNGGDITRYYDIEKLYGTLTVTKRPITIQSASDSKVYDGTPLTKNSYKIVSLYGLVVGHTEEVLVTGERTEIGESPNTIGDYVIRDKNNTKFDPKGEPVTINYEVTKDERMLIVKAPENGGNNNNGGGGGNNNGDDDNGGGGGGGGSNLSDELGISGPSSVDFTKVLARVTTAKTQQVYLREGSYTEYTGRTWKLGDKYSILLDDKYSMSYLTGVSLANNGVTAQQMKIEYVEDGLGYMLPYYIDMDDLSVPAQKSDIAYSGKSQGTVTAYFYQYDYLTQGTINSGELGSYKALEAAYRGYVESQYCKIPQSSIDYFNGVLIPYLGWSKSDPDIIQKVAAYVSALGPYNMYYDRALDAEEDIAVAFAKGGYEGICQHFATTATVFYRALGIPARYTIGYSVPVAGNTPSPVYGGYGHAWVEVYLNGIGWVQVEVTGPGTLPGMPSNPPGLGGGNNNNQNNNEQIVVTPKSVIHKYDGQTYSSVDELEVNKNLQKLMSLGYTYEVKVKDVSRTEAGKSTIEVESFRLYYNNEDVTSQFPIKYGKGTLHVYMYEIFVSTGSKSQTYDGTNLTCDEKIVSGQVGQNHKVLVNVTGAQKNVGVSSNKCDVSVVDETTNQSVTDLYKIVQTYGTLEVTYCEITIVAGSVTITQAQLKNEYGGLLTCNEYVVKGDLAEGHKIVSIHFEGQLRKVGSAENIVSINQETQTCDIRIVDEKGQNVTSNYTIKTQKGMLRVTRN